MTAQVRIYEAQDVMNLSQWSPRDEIHVKLPCSCISWNPSVSRLHPPMVAVGSDEAAGVGAPVGGRVKVQRWPLHSSRGPGLRVRRGHSQMGAGRDVRVHHGESSLQW